MARIRTIKPEFWTDDLIGAVCRDARLLFIASWNLADDEGLLRWTAPYLKGAVFPFDDDVAVVDVQRFMDELTSCGIVFAYKGGRSQQALAYIVNFHKHQKINRPSPSRLPPPPVTDPKVKEMYASRDGGKCHLCDLPFDEKWSEHYEDSFLPSPDHCKPQAAGGSDYPSNIRSAHLTCNKGRRERTVEQYRETLRAGKTAAQVRYPERFANYSLNDSVTEQDQESEREQEEELGRDEEMSAQARPPAPEPNAKEPPNAKSNRATRLPDDWQASPTLDDFAREQGLEPTAVWPKFIDHWRAAAGPNARKLDWDAAARNWCRREAGQHANRPQNIRAARDASEAGAFHRAGMRLGSG